ncbi:MAG: homocysteine biosynthesis protein [Candidatus Lernaella stagnicola]|nr:homocysteine biosynthesis protein [Candidatus Lernaella stagnicola]
MASVKRTFAEINEKIRAKKAVVVTAEELVGIVKDKGVEEATAAVDVVTTGTFSPMCSSGVMLNFGHTTPKIKAQRVWVNDVEAYAGLAAVDCYLGATQLREGDPGNEVYPGKFNYGGGHVITDLLKGRTVTLRAEAHGTDCYPRKHFVGEFKLADFREAWLLNPRNCYQNYNVATNSTDRLIYTYMGVLKPRFGNITYCSAGQLSPLLCDPYYRTIGLGTRIFLGGAQGWVIGPGTQHSPDAKRTADGVPSEGAGTLAVRGNLKEMSSQWVRGVSFLGYGVSLAVGIGVPIPVLDSDVVRLASLGDAKLPAPLIDYGADYPDAVDRVLAEISYADLKSGHVEFNGRQVPTSPLSSYPAAREIAAVLKNWIAAGEFVLGEPQDKLMTR